MAVRVLGYLLLCFFLLAPAARSQGSIALRAESCFAGMAPGGVYPVVVSLQNNGPSVDGAVIVKTAAMMEAERTYTYPLSLPGGSKKRVVVYPVTEQYAGEVKVAFVGPFRTRSLNVPFVSRGGGDGRQVGLIGDQTGGLAALRSSGRGAAYNDCYALPENAPERAAGYQALSILVLTDGAERLNPAQWTAIRQWVMGGGSLILLGGAGATYARVGEASPLVPLQNLRGGTINDLRLPGFGDERLPPGPIAVTSGIPKPGASVLASQGDQVLLATQPMGAGTVLFAAFNPLEKPFRGEDGLYALWGGLIKRTAPVVDAAHLRAEVAKRHANLTPYASSLPPSLRGGTGGEGVDPFRVKLPPTSMVVWVFLAYFALVIPVSAFLLKRLGRREWAWVTSPLLSAAFAYVFYLFTAELYLAGLSRRTSGVVVAAAGQSDARFSGFTELFFPRGGSYKIEVPNAETLELSPTEEDMASYYPYSSSRSAAAAGPLETVDMGTVVAPDFRVANLAFRRVYHTQTVAWGQGIAADIRRDGDGRFTGTVRNGTGQELIGGVLALPGGGQGEMRLAEIGPLKPGAVYHIGKAEPFGSAAGQRLRAQAPLLSVLTAVRQGGAAAPLTGAAVLIADTKGDAFGPALGRYVGAEKSVSVLVSIPVREGQR